MALGTSQPDQAFRCLLLRHRGRTGLTQGQLADRVRVNRRSLQDWEAGVNHPSAERLYALIGACVEAGGFSARRDAVRQRVLPSAAGGRRDPTGGSRGR